MCRLAWCRTCPITVTTNKDYLEEIERLRTVVEAARCIRHWHDSGNDGMVVSGEHVRALWQALHDLDKVPNMSNSKQAQANKEKQIVNPGPSKELWDEVLT